MRGTLTFCLAGVFAGGGVFAGCEGCSAPLLVEPSAVTCVTGLISAPVKGNICGIFAIVGGVGCTGAMSALVGG